MTSPAAAAAAYDLESDEERERERGDGIINKTGRHCVCGLANACVPALLLRKKASGEGALCCCLGLASALAAGVAMATAAPGVGAD